MLEKKPFFRKQFFIYGCFWLGLVGLWEFFSQKIKVTISPIPPPSSLFKVWLEEPQHWWDATLATVSLAASGILCGTICGSLLAVSLYLYPRWRRLLHPFLVVTQNLPLPVLAPLLVIPLGFGFSTRLVVVTLLTFFPVAIAMHQGLGNERASFVRYFTIMGASRWQRLCHLALPGSLPTYFAGIELATTYGAMGAVWAESTGTEKGLGVLMRAAVYGFRTDHLLAVAVLLISISLSLLFLVRFLKHKILANYSF